jgi:hypothetical protein
MDSCPQGLQVLNDFEVLFGSVQTYGQLSIAIMNRLWRNKICLCWVAYINPGTVAPVTWALNYSSDYNRVLNFPRSSLTSRDSMYNIDSYHFTNFRSSQKIVNLTNGLENQNEIKKKKKIFCYSWYFAFFDSTSTSSVNPIGDKLDYTSYYFGRVSYNMFL